MSFMFLTYWIISCSHTAEGLDNLPAWFLRVAAPVFSKVITHIFNLSVNMSYVPLQWKTAVISPIPKIPNPTSPSDFRPISVVPIISRILEKIIVKTHLYPVLENPCSSCLFDDQFAFRPTGSTTSAIISILQSITSLFSADNHHVILISLDFSKAFDSVRHCTLLEKMAGLPIPDHIYNWITSYLDSRSHMTRFSNSLSSSNSITASVVQGSGIGPFSFVITASDLSPISPLNKICKFADDMYLLVPASNAASVCSELKHIETWADKNNLKLNQAKTNEIIFSKPKTRHPKPLPTPFLKSVSSLVILGVCIDSNLKMDQHIECIISSASQSLFALRLLKNNGLPELNLFQVYQATTLAKLLYASQAWWGFTNCNQRQRLDSFVNKSKRLGYCSKTLPSFSDLCKKSDKTLFDAIVVNPNHVLHQLLPPKKDLPYNLRSRTHSFILPEKDDRNFLSRMLYTNIY